MGKVIVVVVALVVLLIVLRLMLSRRDRGTELFVTEARGREPIEGPLEDQVRALLRQRQKIQAIKLVRERAGFGLKEAKDAVEEVERTGRLRLPGSGPDLKQAHLSGEPADFIAEARWHKEHRRALEAIRLIRTHTGLGLKEAKDLYDSL
jgi:large subunit ribosomal protein L7/L12